MLDELRHITHQGFRPRPFDSRSTRLQEMARQSAASRPRVSMLSGFQTAGCAQHVSEAPLVMQVPCQSPPHDIKTLCQTDIKLLLFRERVFFLKKQHQIVTFLHPPQ